ncbi:MAG: hypothetical protein RL607_198 [Bacteroidota bacterium]|jgi:cytochrome c553
MMKQVVLFVFVFTTFLSCQKKEATTQPAAPKKESCAKPKTVKDVDGFEMYKMTEMAALMEQMYVDNKRLRERILKGEAVGSFPEHYLKIYTAEMTDPSENDAFFKARAKTYIEAQKLLYSDTKNAKKYFNAGIDACVQCHEQKCGGPLVRIKKLYIK